MTADIRFLACLCHSGPFAGPPPLRPVCCCFVTVPQVRAPTRPHPEIMTTALPAPFFENQLAATKLVDASLDQARMPALAPTAVGLSPLASAAVISSAMDGAAAGGLTAGGAGGGGGGLFGPLPPQSEGLPAAMRDGQLTGEGLPAWGPDGCGECACGACCCWWW